MSKPTPTSPTPAADGSGTRPGVTAQQDGSDELGWILDVMLRYARGNGEELDCRPCPKAIVRAHARLLRERAARQAAERERDALRGERDRLVEHCTGLIAINSSAIAQRDALRAALAYAAAGRPSDPIPPEDPT